LFESELFSFERGAFTGVKQRKLGLLEKTDGGTHFFDEIDDLDQSM
jgi:transcriptional regulator with PAS, ATPase and Fis domain